MIKEAKPSDSGIYVCEVNSSPILRSFHKLSGEYRMQKAMPILLTTTVLSSWHQDTEIPLYWITWHHIPEDSNLHSYWHENHKSQMQTDCLDCRGFVRDVACDHQWCRLKQVRAEEFSIKAIYLICRMKLVKCHAAWPADNTKCHKLSAACTLYTWISLQCFNQIFVTNFSILLC